MLTLLQEKTQWDNPTENHIYVFDESTTKIVGYIKSGSSKAIRFSKPMMFDKRGRTFSKVKASSFDLSAFEV